ncbi:omega-amidase NIT2-like [Ixodes scapularis]|uniref:omega-amidase NIT2-like n=1 Tax=Ixodes scapularis TaxID=6945 RepID=UPI001A9E8544|nr:omega-amidase NIT2-like [Ixodes scapularis]
MSISKFRMALLQTAVSHNKKENLDRASRLIKKAASAGAKVLCLPECFTFPYEPKYFPRYAEKIPGETSEMLSCSAKENQVYLVGGSMSESEAEKLYNTCLVYGPDGSMLAKHRKVHLFNVNIPGKIIFNESEFLAAGHKVTTFDTPFCKVGVGICYDMAFSPFVLMYTQLGCKLLVFPGAFNMVTGPLYWEILSRCRAAESQVYLASVSPARDEAASYVNWGHSMLVNPSGKVIGSAASGEELVLADVDLDYLDLMRYQLPMSKHGRNDLYKIVTSTNGETNATAS